ncbi:MAG: adenylate/guanylate cyclase domain-containing protein [Pseudomonadota bacterium]
MRARHLFRFVITAAVFVPFYLHISGIARLGFLDDLESVAYDARLLLTLPNTVDDRIVIVDIDESSMRKVGHWPWPRRKVADLVDQLFDRYQVRVVGFDVLFPEADTSSGLQTLERLAADTLAEVPEFTDALTAMAPDLDYDRALAESLADRPTVLGYVFRQSDAFDSANALPPPILTQAEHGTTLDYPTPRAYTGSLTRLVESAGGGGFIDNPLIDPDGTFRRVPLLQSYQGDLYESLALAVTRQALDAPPLGFHFHGGDDVARDGLNIEWLTLGERRIPVDEAASVLVPYRGPQFHFPYVSAAQVLDGTAPGHVLADKIILIGTSAAGLRDARVTPVGAAFHGVEVQANIVSGILDERIKHHPRYARGIELLMLAAVAGIMTIVLTRLPVVTATLSTILLINALIFANLHIWTRYNFVLPLAALLVFAFTLYLAHMILGYVTETRGRRRLSHAFGQYVPPELVDEMDNRSGAFTMESESRELTVLFSDIRGFTSISESMPPRELSQLMNEFLTAMTEVIHAERGTIDKYMGDAVMAFWGAPIRDADHARHAVVAATRMQAALDALADDFAARGWPRLRVGIGINSGDMRVGDMGSRFRRAYTVLGDAVNLGARLEGLTRKYDSCVIVGERTYELVPDHAFLELDRVRVKGKDQPVAIYEPIGPRDALGPGEIRMLAEHTAALAALRAGDWDRAEAGFFKLKQLFPDKRVFSMYLDRIAHYRTAPPDVGWDGVVSYAAK